MSRFNFFSSVIFTGLVLLAFSFSAYADELIQIVTPVPPPKEAPNIPPGYVGCFTVSAAWIGDVWYPEHRVCQYDPAKSQAAEGQAYVEAHWACTKYSTESGNTGNCVNWSWRKGRWIKTFSAY